MTDEPRWVIYLPTTLTSLDAAVELACGLRASLAHLPVLDFGELALAEEDKQFLRTRIWCDARADATGGEPDCRRCRLPDHHPGPWRPTHSDPGGTANDRIRPVPRPAPQPADPARPADHRDIPGGCSPPSTRATTCA